MKRSAKRAALTVLTTAIVAATLTGVASTSALAIDGVPCDSNDFVKLTLHRGDQGSYDNCYANGGEMDFDVGDLWLTHIHTGNNHVQWFGDGRWQPDTPIPPNTEFGWDNHPGGVSVEKIRIV